MEKVKAKIADQQAKLKELEQKHREAENEEIVDIVRGMSVSLSDLPGLLQAVKAASGNLGVPAKPQGFVGERRCNGRADFGTLCPEGAERSLQRRDPKTRRQNLNRRRSLWNERNPAFGRRRCARRFIVRVYPPGLCQR